MTRSTATQPARRFPLHSHITTLFLVLNLLVGGIIAGVGFKLSRDMLETTATDLIDGIGRETRNEFAALIEPAELAMNLVRYDVLSGADNFDARSERLPFLKEAQLGVSALSSIYTSYAKGDFFFCARCTTRPSAWPSTPPKAPVTFCWPLNAARASRWA